MKHDTPSRSRPARWSITGAAMTLVASVPFLSPAVAVATTPIKPQVSYSDAKDKETVGQRISAMRIALRITPAQEAAWENVAGVMRRNDADMQKLAAERRAKTPVRVTAIDDLKIYESFNQAHLDGLKNLIASFEVLYASMPEAQQANADQVMARFGRAPAILHGRHHMKSVT